eukprot:900159-Alexandrium_andersonii.AAC.1
MCCLLSSLIPVERKRRTPHNSKRPGSTRCPPQGRRGPWLARGNGSARRPTNLKPLAWACLSPLE